MLDSELTDWSEGVVVEEKQSVLQRTTAFLNDREVRKEELRSLRYAVVSLKLKAQGILNFASLKRNRSTGEAPIVTKNDDGLATLLRAYPIASSICQHLTSKDLQNLAAAVPSVMWADTKKVLADPQPPLLRMHPDVAIVFPAQLRNMYKACRARVGTFIPYPGSRRALKSEVLVDFFTRIIPEFKARLEELEHRRIRTCSLDRIEPNITAYRRAHRRSEKVLRLYNDYRSELGKMAETAEVMIPACFGLYKPPGKMTLWEPSVSDNRRQNIPARPRSASLPNRRKPDISTFLFDPEPDLAISNTPSKECTPLRDFRVQKCIMTDQLNHRRLQDLLVGLHGTDTVAPRIYHLQDLLQLSIRRYDLQCKCIAEGAQVCFYHGLRLSAKAEQMDFWTRFWFEVPHSAVMNPEKPLVNVSEDELESLIDAYPGWDYLDRQRVEEIVSARIDAKRNGIRPLWNPGCADSSPYWESLQHQTSECACCGLSKPKLDAKFEKIWEVLGNARRGFVRAHPVIQDMAALMLAEYLGTTECWGCYKMFCNTCMIKVFVQNSSWPGTASFSSPRTPRPSGDIIRQFLARTDPRCAYRTHTFVCAKCFIEYFHNRGGKHGKESKPIHLFQVFKGEQVGVAKPKCRIRDIGVSAAMCWGQAPFLSIISGDQQVSTYGLAKAAVVGEQSFGWRLCGAPDLSFAFFSPL